MYKFFISFLSIFITCVTLAQPKIDFLNKIVDVGNIYEGELPTVKYVYKNIGNQPLKLNKVKSSCGCYSPSWTGDSTLPKMTDTIKATYTSIGHLGGIFKAIYVSSNGSDKEEELIIKGTVIPFDNRYQVYYGGSDRALTFKVLKERSGSRLLFKVKKNAKELHDISLVIYTNNDTVYNASIPKSTLDKSNISLKVLHQNFLTNKLNYIPSEQFTFAKNESCILYIKPRYEVSSSFDIFVNSDKINVQIEYE